MGPWRCTKQKDHTNDHTAYVPVTDTASELRAWPVSQKRVAVKRRAKAAQNSAVIRLTFPDGCRIKIESRRDADIATDTLKFIAWLKETAEEWLERATTSGMCAPKEKGPS